MTLVVLPVLLPLATAIACMAALRRPSLQARASLLGSAATLAGAIALFAAVHRSGPQLHTMGGWQPPFGIVLVADLLGASMVLLACTVGVLSLRYAAGYLTAGETRLGFHPLFHFLLMGMNGAFLTGDIFNLFVFFEILLLASYALVAYGGTGAQLEAALKYAALSLVGSAVFLVGVGALYGLTGTLNLAHLSVQLARAEPTPLLVAILLLFLIVFGTKAAAFPLHFWLPDAHSSAPTPMSAMLSGVLIKVGAYAILRIVALMGESLQDAVRPTLLVVAALTMTVGAIGALAQHDLKRLLAYSSIGQMGFILLGIALASPDGIGGALLLIVNHSLAKALLFLAAGHVIHATGIRDLRAMGGLGDRLPGTSVAFLIGALAIAGVPPAPGFFGKLQVLQAALAAGHPLLAGLGAATAVASLLYLFSAWQQAFWGTPANQPHQPVPAGMRSPVTVLAALLVAVTLALGGVTGFLAELTASVREPAHYTRLVLGGGRWETAAGGPGGAVR